MANGASHNVAVIDAQAHEAIASPGGPAPWGLL